MPSATAPTPSASSSTPASGPDEAAAVAPEAGFGVYVHWPFCLAKCPYCDFNSHVGEGVDQARWRAALVAEIEHYGALAPGRPVTSVFFGGGTPSLMEPATVAAVLEAVAAAWPAAPDWEVTLEANPTSAEARRFAGYRAAGVNRLSLGVQALDDDALRFLGRGHDAGEARAALADARRHFDRTSLDLIYARPGQSRAAWRAELGDALALAEGHLSLYQLTIEKGTPFYGAWRRGRLAPPGEDDAAALYETTGELCEAAGLPAYEVSNHARPGEECRHNLTYWRSGDYVGVGPGAHGRLTLGEGRVATRQLRGPGDWLCAVEARGHGTESREVLSPRVQAQEVLMMGLRLDEGISTEAFRRRLGLPIEAAVDGQALERLRAGGFLEGGADTLRVTPAGRLVLNAVLAELIV